MENHKRSCFIQNAKSIQHIWRSFLKISMPFLAIPDFSPIIARLPYTFFVIPNDHESGPPLINTSRVIYPKTPSWLRFTCLDGVRLCLSLNLHRFVILVAFDKFRLAKSCAPLLYQGKPKIRLFYKKWLKKITK